MSNWAYRVVLLFSVLASLGATASAQDVEVNFIPPSSSGVAGYNVYIAPTTSGPLVAAPIDVGRPQPDGGGIAHARVSVTPSPGLVIEMTSYDASRRESARSNRVVLVRGSESLGNPIWSANFSSSAVGSLPPGFGSSANFGVAQYPAGNLAMGVADVDGLQISRYTGSGSSSWEPYELSGRLFFQPGARRGGVAVRVPLAARTGTDPFGSGFRFGSDSGGVFVLQSGAGRPLSCANSTSTGVSALALRWYQFRLRYTEPDDRSRLRAKVWISGTAEPAAWQVDCWTDDLPAVDSGVFALYRDGWGVAYWDDLVVRPVVGWWELIPYL